jgi:hypothetical protein
MNLISLIILVNPPNSLTRQISDGVLSTASSDDSSTTTEASYSSTISIIDPSLPLNKPALTSSNIQSLIDSTLSPSKVSNIFFLLTK